MDNDAILTVIRRLLWISAAAVLLGVVLLVVSIRQRERLARWAWIGREVAVVSYGERDAGSHTFRLDTERLAPGTYVIRLTTGVGTLHSRAVTVTR